MPNKIAKMWPLIPSALWAVFGVVLALDPASCEGRVRSIVWLGAGMLLLFLNLGLCVLQSTRAAALTSMILLIASAPGHFLIRVNRLDYGRNQIEAVYTAVAKQGPPFPDKLDETSKTVPGYMEWYYQKHSDEKFAVVYLVCSDGWAMEYPSAQWQFIGFRPDGYVPLADPNRGPNAAIQPTRKSKAD